jgi:hypothetical protein
MERRFLTQPTDWAGVTAEATGSQSTPVLKQSWMQTPASTIIFTWIARSGMKMGIDTSM